MENCSSKEQINIPLRSFIDMSVAGKVYFFQLKNNYSTSEVKHFYEYILFYLG
jgi:hypothetical protein